MQAKTLALQESKHFRLLWLGREDSNLRPADSKSVILPLNYFPTSLVLGEGFEPHINMDHNHETSPRGTQHILSFWPKGEDLHSHLHLNQVVS